MKNKILSIVLCLALTLSAGLTVLAENTGEISFETKVMRGLFAVDSDFETNPDDELSRGDFVRILMDMIGAPEENKLTVEGFSDLSKGASYSKAVIYAANRGYVRGYDDGTFKANNPITAQEAAIIVLKVAGYDMAVASSEVDETNYLNVASSQRLFRGISSGYNAPMTKKDVAQLLYNALTVEVFSLASIEGGSITVKRDGELFMDTFMDMYRYRGIITSTYKTSLSGEATCLKGEIALGGATYDLGYEKAEEYLGYNVEAYVKLDDNNDKVMVFAIPYKTDVVEINAEDILSQSDNTTVYYEINDGNDSEKIKVRADAAKIVNGTADLYSSMKDLYAEVNMMTFIDYDEDGVYDVVICYAFDEMYVGSVSGSDEIIYSKYTFNGVTQSLDLEDVDELTITKDGAPIRLHEIKADNVISVIETDTDDKRIVEINVSDKYVTGTITKIDTDEDIVYIDNTEYKLSQLYKAAYNNKDLYAKAVEIGVSGTFYLNPFGRITAFTIDDEAKRYGYLKKAYIDDTGADIKVKFKILGTDGDWQLYELIDKVRVNDVKVNSENIFTELGSNTNGIVIQPQLVEFELNKNSQIKSVAKSVYDADYRNDDFRYITLNQEYYRNSNQSFNSKVYISGNTVTYSIPTLKTGGIRLTDEELSNVPDKYFVVNSGPIYSDWSQYTLNVYNANKFGYTDLLVMESVLEDVGKFSASNFLFSKLTQSVSGDSEVRTMIEGLHGTNISASASLSEDVMVFDKEKNEIGEEILKQVDISYLEEGDLLSLYLDLNDEVYRIDVIYEAGDKEGSRFDANGLHANEVMLKGTVEDVDSLNGFVLLNDGLDTPKTIRLYTSNLSVYIFDSEERNNPIKVGNINDIQRGDFIFMKGGQSSFGFVVIYK